jgi:glycosyltransferase involved in cell wall biosynthesis
VTDVEATRPLLLGLGWSPDQPGGLNRYFRDLLTALDDPAAVVVGPARDAPATTTVVSDHRAPLPTRLRAFARAVGSEPCDVVDAHFALYAAWPVLLGAARHAPLVVHFHGPWAREAEAEHGARRSSTRVRRAIERAVYRRAARVVTLSGAFARLLVHEYGVDPWRIEIVRPGVDLERFHPDARPDAHADDRQDTRAALGVSGATTLVLAVRRLVPRTGVDVLLDAWSAVGGDAVLVIAGDGPERSDLEQRARERGLRGARFLGPVPDADLPALYRAADVCVVPSVALEGFGLVVLEALASGTPVVVSDAGGLPEAVAGIGDDLVVPAGDAGALGRLLERVVDGRAPLPSRAACRTHAESFAWPAVALRHRRLYADVRAPTDEPRRPRVLFVDHCARMSGGEIALLRTTRALAGVDAHVVTFEDGPLLPALGAAAITSEIVALPARTRDLRRSEVGARLPWRAAVDSAVQVGRLARRIRRLRPDVVHTNSLKASVLGGLAARIARVPCVWHVRDHVDTDALPRPAVALVRALARRVPSAVVANSESTMASLHLPPRGGPLRRVIADPVPDEFFAPTPSARRAREERELVVGMVGRLAPWKGQDVFLAAFARAFPDGTTRARIVGDALFGEDKHRAALHAQVARLGIADRVEFRGFRTDVRAELAELDVLVHASVQPEPFGQVVVEGMAAGLAVVATDAGGPAEIIDSGHDGVLVPPGDADALAAALRDLADDPDRRARLGRHARATAARYRTDAIVPHFTALYAELRSAR